MIPLSELLNRLGYDKSRNYRPTDGLLDPETAHLFRAAQNAGVSGIYVFEASPGPEQKVLSARPAVHIAEASNEKEARRIHCRLWNLSYAPFLIVLLPHQIRIYTGFDYSEEPEEAGLLEEANHLQQLRDLLSDFTADSIDTGRIWQSKYAKNLDPNRRVDKRLLGNLEQLGQALKEDGLRDEVAHALIGKYVYLRYLRDRHILSNEWLAQQQIDPHSVFTLDATISGLRKIDEAIEDWFNGKIFPIEFDDESSLKDEHVSWVASVFSGAEIKDTAPEVVRQLHLPFQAYDFQYIPVGTLSSIYEQFLYERKKKGAIYTPEVLADYLLSEVEWAKPLERGMKILDPACGSGVFLVLAYRRLIEKEANRLGRELKPEELRDILWESIYGVERERDACYVAEFSLILTLLHYVVESHGLQKLRFQLPDLHNKRIFECDFFDPEGEQSEAKFWRQGLEFDWIVGNPPWIELKPDTKGEKFVRAWIENPKNRNERPIGGNRVAEAFSWLVTDLLDSEGVIGLLLPATSLFNLESQEYRQRFFTEHEVLRVTNFANLRDMLFGKRARLPAATVIYRQGVDTCDKSYIIHYGPFSINQVSGTKNEPWVITVNESEIQTISPYEAQRGETSLWKLALWGTHRDKRAIERIQYLFPTTLQETSEKRGWYFSEGAQLRDGSEESSELEYIPELKGNKRFQTVVMTRLRFRFSIPRGVLEDIPDEMCYIRKRGGKAGLNVTQAPHLILSPVWQSYIAYSDEDFVIAPRQMGIAASKKSQKEAEYLRALSVYLSSNLVAYYLFFHAPEWGVFRQARLVPITGVRKIPTPELTPEQVEELATLQKELVKVEKQGIADFVSKLLQRRMSFDEPRITKGIAESGLPEGLTGAEKKELEYSVSQLQASLQEKIDNKVFNLFKIPEGIRLLVNEFIQTRLPLDKPSAIEHVIRKPTEQELLAYARELRDELDDFVMGKAYHRVIVTHSSDLIECIVEITKEDAPIPVNGDSIKAGDLTPAKLLAELSDSLREQISQWVYVQRGLRLFDGPRIYIYKAPRLIDWTRTQAMNDAGDIIGEAIATAWKLYENT